jgi:hypothetical protein
MLIDREYYCVAAIEFCKCHSLKEREVFLQILAERGLLSSEQVRKLLEPNRRISVSLISSLVSSIGSVGVIKASQERYLIETGPNERELAGSVARQTTVSFKASDLGYLFGVVTDLNSLKLPMGWTSFLILQRSRPYFVHYHQGGSDYQGMLIPLG